MDKYFVWIVPHDLKNSFQRKGLASHYVIPKGMIHGNELQLLGVAVWVIVRGKHDIVTLYLQFKRIEKFAESINEGDFLAQTDFKKSFKITRHENSATNFVFDGLAKITIGINEIPAEINDKLVSMVISKVQTKLQSPEKLVNGLKYDDNYKNQQGKSRKAMRVILENFCLDEVWASKMNLNISPFANFAYTFVSGKKDMAIAKQLLPYFQSVDPLTHFTVNGRTENKKLESKVTMQIVDNDLTEIDISTIYARDFIADKYQIDIEAALEKTEVAEKLHQDMLRDIAMFLRLQNIIPYESNSIDLLFNWKSFTRLIEIKSTTNNNLMAQCARGAFQLAFYHQALMADFTELKSALIIHKIDSQDILSNCLSILEKLNTTCLIYDPEQEWPNKVQGLFD
jgi:hypothetical protein